MTHWADSKTKRACDILGVLLLAPVCLPVCLLTAIAVRCFLGKPVFFIQERPGLHNRPFRLVKFRSMRDGHGSDAERLTRFGRLLRATSLDELPELWNILRGDMSFIGPRPQLMCYLPRYTPEQLRRHDIRPGLTGWAQVNGRNLTTWEERFKLDLHYVDHATPFFDLRIVWLTFRCVFKCHGVQAQGHATMSEFSGTETPHQGEKRDK